MYRSAWFLFFLIVLAGHILAILLRQPSLEYIFKPLIVPALAGFFITQVKNTTSTLKKWVLFALFFSWAGDVLLMFQQKNELYFLLGLSAFLLAHVFYIIFFHHVKVREKVKSNPWLLLIVVLYYAALIVWLSPYLGDKKIPVRIYGIVISFMFMLAMHMLYIKERTAGRWMMAGALLFVVSDSVLAINKFYSPFTGADILIMVTYGLAQFFIAAGAIRYLRSISS